MPTQVCTSRARARLLESVPDDAPSSPSALPSQFCRRRRSSPCFLARSRAQVEDEVNQRYPMHAATRTPTSVRHSGMITLTAHTLLGREGGGGREEGTIATERGRAFGVDDRTTQSAHQHALTLLQFSVRFRNSRIPPDCYLITYAPRTIITFVHSGYGTALFFPSRRNGPRAWNDR